MKKKKKLLIPGVLTIIIAFTCGFLSNDILTQLGVISLRGFSRSQLLIIDEAERLIESSYINDTDDDLALTYALKGMAASLDDDYAYYYSPEELALYNDATNGVVSGGIGVSVKNDDDGIIITEVFKGLSAEKAGLKPGDVVLSVDGEDIADIGFSDFSKKVKGEDGTTVELTVSRNGTKYNFIITRCSGERELTEYSIIDGTDILYIKIISFHNNAAELFKKAIEYGEENGYESIIIDLRENYGGDVEILGEIADVMLPEGETFCAKDKNGKKVETCQSDASFIDKPTCVLINGESASASEALAGALRDMGNATVIGTKSFGKGIMQTCYKLMNGGVFKFTTAKYYLPSGECIHGTGITPDITVELSDELTEKYWLRDSSNDLQLKKAIEVLRG